MKRVAVVLMIAAGSATAEPSVDAPSDSNSINMESSATNASTIYPVDEDRDGRADRLLILEHSDSLA